MVLFLFCVCESYRRRFECFAVRNQGRAFPELLDLLRRKQSVEKLRRDVVVFLSSNPPFFQATAGGTPCDGVHSDSRLRLH